MESCSRCRVSSPERNTDRDGTFVRCTAEMMGVVQGVGLRPAVYRLATRAGLSGHILNTSGTVRLVLEGLRQDVAAFMEDLPRNLPPFAALEGIRVLSIVPISPPAVSTDRSGFEILSSETNSPSEICVPPDLAICSACRAEVLDSSNRRFAHPFATCTACGPRYTILSRTPYDRANTSMRRFEMCPECREEYANPSDRRFHAETIACPNCGPQLKFRRSGGCEAAGLEALFAARAEIARGAIVAVKGIGGFLIAVNPFNPAAVRRLRQLKHRPHKPFALMVENVSVARKWAVVCGEAQRLMESSRCPIVILPLRPDAVSDPKLPVELISPDAPVLGMMLPAAPLLLLLLKQLPGDSTPPFEALIMTSGNRRDEPICATDEEADSRLRGIADCILTHDRDILTRCDDSVCVIRDAKAQVWRRARGYAPESIRLPLALGKPVLAMGAEIKNTIAFGYDASVIMSQHIGDLASPEASDLLEKNAESLLLLLGRKPECVAVDLHPDMHSTRYGERIASRLSIPVVRVQHHAAHAAAVLAEHGYSSGPALVFDGGGLGSDGSIWGAEMFLMNGCNWKRGASFAPAPLPGGDAAVRNPSRQLLARWIMGGIKPSGRWLERLGFSGDEYEALCAVCSTSETVGRSSGAGRVFDAWAAALGIAAGPVTYEGQAAVRLEAAARRYPGHPPSLPLRATLHGDMLLVDWTEAFALLHDSPPAPADVPALAAALHHAMARAAIMMIEHALSICPFDHVGLTGGVFMNEILSELVMHALKNRNIAPLPAERVPPNDGGISFGQIVLAGATSDEGIR